MRKVTIASTKASSGVAINDFSGRTFGDLRNNSTFSGLFGGDLQNEKVIINPGKITVTDDTTVLPEGDLVVMIIPAKNKAGNDQAEILSISNEIKEISKMAKKLAKRLKRVSENIDTLSPEVRAALDEANALAVAEIH